jgi:hypothetical protein
MIRPSDRSIKGRTLTYGPYGSSEATRRYIELAFRDCWTALDLTVGSWGFWRRRVPPGLVVTTNNIDRRSRADLHLDFTDTRLPDGSYDLAIYDPPHLADLGADSILRERFGSASSTADLDALVTAGVREAWRLARVGVLVKLTDSSHGGEYLQLSRWVFDEFAMRPYFVAHTTRAPIEDRKWKVQRVPRSNGAVYLVWRKAGHLHVDFDAMYERQERRNSKRSERQIAREIARRNRPKRCSECFALLDQSSQKVRRTCSLACRLKVFRRRAKGAPLRAFRWRSATETSR